MTEGWSAAIVNRLWRGYADVQRTIRQTGSAARARPALGVDRSDVAAWTERTAELHESYRRTVDPVEARVAVVCVSARPSMLDSVLDAVHRQTHSDLELVLVTNSRGYDDIDVEAAAARVGHSLAAVTVLRRSEHRTLGSCLNDALDTTGARFVAKFDDDDRYGADYLADALRAHSYAGAGVVGKHTYYAHLVEPDETVLRFPAHEFTYTSTLAGGTLVIDRGRTGDLRFEDRSLGEDRAFIAACHRRGVSTFSADRFNFVQSRGGDNTWAVGEQTFRHKTVAVSRGLPLAEIDI